MAGDAPAKGTHGGSRPGSGRPRGSKNIPKTSKSKSRVSNAESAPAAASSASEASASTMRKPINKVLTGLKNTGRGIANFWATHVPQGIHSMTGTGATDLAPDEPISAADALARLQNDMQTANLSQPVSERVLDENIEDGGDVDEGAALLDDEVDEGDEDDELHLDAEQGSAETASNSVNAQWLAPTLRPHRSALDISQMDTMKITFAGRFGADPFSKMVHELKYLRHSRLEAMYLHAALHYGLRGDEQIPAFSAFKNQMGFAGYTPSTKYLKSMFTSWFASHRLYIDRIMSSLSGRIIKADHTFKTVDHQGRLPGGEAIHTALYDAVNDAEEVRFYGLTLTQGFAPLQGMYERLQVELVRHGNPPTEAIYTDNPRLERNWHETVTPSLKRNVQHIVLNPFRDLPEFKVSGPPLFASSPDRIDTLCDEILQSLPEDDSIYVALSIQFTADKLTAIQIRTSSLIHVFDVTFLTTHIPLALKSVLTHPQIIKFGHEINSTAKWLSSAWSLAIPTATLVDLAKLAKLKGASADTNCSISTLCGAVLNFQFNKPNLSTPPPPVLSQLADLAREVDCAWSIQVALMKLGSVGIPLQPSQMRPAQPVAFVMGNTTQAWGELVEHNGSLIVPNTQGTVSVTKAYSVIKLTKLFVPGFIVAKHGQTLEWLNANGGHAVVQTRTLRSRANEPPHSATESTHNDPDLGIPAPVAIPSVTEQLLQQPHTHPGEVAAAIGHQSDVDLDSSGEDDDLMDESPEPSRDNLEQLLLDSIQHAQDILRQPHTAETNVAALEPIHALLRDSSRKAIVLPAITHETVEVDYNTDPFVGVDLSSFNPTAMRQQLTTQRAVQAAIAAVPNLEPPPVQLREQSHPEAEFQQTILTFASVERDGDYALMEMARPAKKRRLDGLTKSKRAPRWCAFCAHAGCGMEETCKGRGGRERCEHKSQPNHRELGFEESTRKRYRRGG
ncbi:hypothetical protein B0H16DRAFT_1780652 [Mycena metata]|uniref:3'-5' exonuclease domain-containing protein n=1 Tax=Mycena metata TaxID=1033252 RepID=A0AAD7HR01_9AGAR|nr:hypothetical protein B0H16DRAFT_1780652 [Mycena metata]